VCEIAIIRRLCSITHSRGREELSTAPTVSATRDDSCIEFALGEPGKSCEWVVGRVIPDAGESWRLAEEAFTGSALAGYVSPSLPRDPLSGYTAALPLILAGFRRTRQPQRRARRRHGSKSLIRYENAWRLPLPACSGSAPRRIGVLAGCQSRPVRPADLYCRLITNCKDMSVSCANPWSGGQRNIVEVSIDVDL